MQEPINSSANPVATNVAVSVGPAAIGAAIGLLLSETMDKRTRRTTAASLLAVGALSALPFITSLVMQKVNSPRFRRGSARTLDSIRGGAGVFEEDDYLVD